MARRPRWIDSTATIAFVAPSCGAATEPYRTRVREAARTFREQGFDVREGKNTYLWEGVFASNTPEERAEEFMDAYLSDAELLLSVGGGELMCEMLPFVDFEKVRKAEPKWFMGFSDNTNLTFTLTTLEDVETVYGPCAGQFFSYPFRLDCLDALRLLRGEKDFEGYPLWEKQSLSDELHPLLPLNLTEKKVLKVQNYRAPFEGTLLGGCLDCLITLCGTRFDKVREYVERTGKIVWYLEACDLTPLSIRRALFQLREAGWFSTAAGFIIGRPLCGDVEMGGVNKYNAVEDILKGLDVPILFDCDLGHYPPSLPLRNGAKARIEAEDGNWHVHYIE